MPVLAAVERLSAASMVELNVMEPSPDFTELPSDGTEGGPHYLIDYNIIC